MWQYRFAEAGHCCVFTKPEKPEPSPQRDMLREDVTAIAGAWGLSPRAQEWLVQESGQRSGEVAYYDATGKRCPVDGKLEGDDRDAALLKAAQGARVIYWGSKNPPGTAMLWLVKEEKDVELARRLQRKVTGGCRSTFQWLTAPDMVFGTNELPASPEPWAQRVWAKVGDGGFTAAVASLMTTITFFTTAAISGATSWVPLGISLVLLLVGLFIGCVGHFLYRRLAAPEVA
jgi:hypothetical protein